MRIPPELCTSAGAYTKYFVLRGEPPPPDKREAQQIIYLGILVT